jgi:hypothetical protein
VVQRLQRFATYGSLKQQVLRIITDELAEGEEGQQALQKVRCLVLCGMINCVLGRQKPSISATEVC